MTKQSACNLMRSLPKKLRLPLAGLTLAVCSWSTTEAQAQTTGSAPQLYLELNRLEQVESACRASFVAQNTIGSDLSGIGFEFVLFNKEGLIEQMSSFDFGALNNGKTIVRRFDLKADQCLNISRILVNRISKCATAQPSEVAANCELVLKIGNKTNIQFGN
ncbi:MAG: hypothetical protein U5K75_08330 [Ahrensia sp.]|nr:hypothetical protein [Ahrensia sp.]